MGKKGIKEGKKGKRKEGSLVYKDLSFPNFLFSLILFKVVPKKSSRWHSYIFLNMVLNKNRFGQTLYFRPETPNKS